MLTPLLLQLCGLSALFKAKSFKLGQVSLLHRKASERHVKIMTCILRLLIVQKNHDQEDCSDSSDKKKNNEKI